MNYASFLLQNPWRSGEFEDDGSIEREILPSVIRDLEKREITVITGSRQVGKTTLLMDIISHLLEQGVSGNAIFYFNLDDFNLLSYKDLDTLVKFHHDDMSSLLNEFLTYGGYPKAILARGAREKAMELKEIYDSYVKKDVKERIFLKRCRPILPMPGKRYPKPPRFMRMIWG